MANHYGDMSLFRLSRSFSTVSRDNSNTDEFDFICIEEFNSDVTSLYVTF